MTKYVLFWGPSTVNDNESGYFWNGEYGPSIFTDANQGVMGRIHEAVRFPTREAAEEQVIKFNLMGDSGWEIQEDPDE